MKKIVSILLILFVLFSCKEKVEIEEKITTIAEIVDPLPSWNEGNTKNAIINYVKEATTEGSENFIPISERVAVFDNDGNLWSEQPAYFQLFFVH